MKEQAIDIIKSALVLAAVCGIGYIYGHFIAESMAERVNCQEDKIYSNL